MELALFAALLVDAAFYAGRQVSDPANSDTASMRLERGDSSDF